MQITGDFLAQIFPLLILIALGFLLIVVWAFWVVSRREKRKKESRAEDPASAAPQPPPQAPAATFSPVTAMPSEDAVEVFRVLQDVSDGSLIVVINGIRYRRLTDITDGQVGRRFVAQARVLAHFARLLKGPPPPMPALERLAPVPPQPSATPPTPTPPPLTTPGPVTAPAPAGPAQAEGEEAAPGMLNVADEIEELLQRRLLQNPQLARRSIHVRPSFRGGVRIVVDDTSYEGVDEVPEPEVRAFIQETIQEWNARR